MADESQPISVLPEQTTRSTAELAAARTSNLGKMLNRTTTGERVVQRSIPLIEQPVGAAGPMLNTEVRVQPQPITNLSERQERSFQQPADSTDILRKKLQTAATTLVTEQPKGTASMETLTQEPGSLPLATQNINEGFLSKWARRLGLKR